MKKQIVSFLFLLAFALTPVQVFAAPRGQIAQNTTTTQFTTFCSRSANPGECEKCFNANPPQAWTAIGCIPAEPGAFVSKFLGFGIGIAGGIAFLLILFGGFQILTSAGNPEQLNGGRELVSSAVAGLLLIVFSVFILRLIGVDLLGIPGFK